MVPELLRTTSLQRHWCSQRELAQVKENRPLIQKTASTSCRCKEDASQGCALSRPRLCSSYRTFRFRVAFSPSQYLSSSLLRVWHMMSASIMHSQGGIEHAKAQGGRSVWHLIDQEIYTPRQLRAPSMNSLRVLTLSVCEYGGELDGSLTAQ